MAETRRRAIWLLLAAAIGPGPGVAAAPPETWPLAPALILAAAPGPGAGSAVGAPAERRLVIVGGGERPREAMARFVEWGGGPAARLVVVTWSSIEPKETCAAILAELRDHKPGLAECAPFARLDAKGKAGPLDAESRARFLGQLAAATGVFFSGGDQARIMDVLADAELLRAVRERHAQGVVFGGTSAGAAALASRMITGDGDFTVIDGDQVAVREGLGLAPGLIIDMHFVKRQRQNRLFGLVLKHPDERGVGIDEDTALLVTGGRHAEVVGKGPVLLVDAAGPDRLEVTILRSGQSVDLQQRRQARHTRRRRLDAHTRSESQQRAPAGTPPDAGEPRERPPGGRGEEQARGRVAGRASGPPPRCACFGPETPPSYRRERH
jgi:cyanophycinase